MKIGLALLLALAITAPAQERPRVGYLIHQLRCLDQVEGTAVGFPPWPGRFYLLAPYFIQYATTPEVVRMMQDKCPIVRLMAAQCIVSRADLRDLDLKPMCVDPQKLRATRSGCAPDIVTLGDLVRLLIKNPKYFLEVSDSVDVGPAVTRRGPKTEVTMSGQDMSEGKLACPEETEEANQPSQPTRAKGPRG